MFTNSISKIFVVLGVLAVALVTISFVNQPASVVAADHSYDGVEQMRALRPAAFIVPSFVYESLETLRLQRKASASAASSGYDLIEQVRMGRRLSADHSYEQIEALRLQR